MHDDSYDLHDLAARVRGGDPGAAAEMRQNLETQMTVMARQVIRTGTRNTVLARRILAEADRLSPGGRGHPGEDPERLVRQVARRICDSVIDRLRSSPTGGLAARETIRM